MGDLKNKILNFVGLDKKKSAWKLVFADWASSMSFKNKLHAQWHLSEMFYEGSQWMEIDPMTSTLNEKFRGEQFSRLVINKIAPYVTKMVSTLSASIPDMSVIPANNDKDDIDVAEVASKYLQYLDVKIGEDEKRKECILYMTLYGNSFRRPFFNHKKGEFKPVMDAVVDENGSSVMGDDGAPLMQPQFEKDGTPKMYQDGDIDVAIINPFIVHVNTDASCFEEVRWLIEARGRHVSWVKENYGYEVQPNKNLNYETETSWTQDKDASNTKADVKDVVPVLEAYYLPSECKKFKDFDYIWNTKGFKPERDGMYMVVCEGKILHLGPLPRFDTEMVRLPHYHYKWEPVPRQFWGMSPIERAIPLQQEMNRIRSEAADIRVRTVKPYLLVPKGAKIDTQNITNAPGQIIEYQAIPGNASKPEWLYPPDVGGTYYSQYIQASQDFEDVLFFHEQSQGKVAAGTTSGVHASELRAADEAYLEPIIKNIEKNERGIAQDKLQLAKKHEIDDMVEIGDDYIGIKTKKFAAANLDYGFSIKIIRDSLKPLTRSERFGMIQNLMGLGLLDPMQDKEKIYKLIQLNIQPTQLYAEQRKHEAWAERENRTILQGLYSEPDQIADDHLVHVNMHMQEMAGKEFHAAEPELQDLLKTHMLRHIEFLTPDITTAGDAGASLDAGMLPAEPQAEQQ